MAIKMFEIHRKVLLAAVSSSLVEAGFDAAEQTALETLTEMLQSIIVEIGNSSRVNHELAGRTEPLFADVILSLINMGIRLSELESYAKRLNKSSVPAPIKTVEPKELDILQAGVKQEHPPHVPSHLPPFPDPHAYIRTPTHKQPVTEYEAIREKSAVQKRDIERALNKFVSKIRETDSLFLTHDSMFPLIACKPQYSPYLTALLPKDQIFEYNEYDMNNRSPQRKKGKEIKEEDEEETSKIDNDQIDNPYLRPVKLPPPKIKIKDLLTPQSC
ncbi:transcription initiation factor TFIID subunit 8 [Cimex lectularius]|uniref:Transcription initiation factor TFIID subunit 8 n=1 Tax=Cimex lectularius TaxID=79782 RepID=A0A8I6RC93_CIMLE|nr:transcription initiation factor TFIID subunit 8 [Cimex lectularius]